MLSKKLLGFPECGEQLLRGNREAVISQKRIRQMFVLGEMEGYSPNPVGQGIVTTDLFSFILENEDGRHCINDFHFNPTSSGFIGYCSRINAIHQLIRTAIEERA